MSASNLRHRLVETHTNGLSSSNGLHEGLGTTTAMDQEVANKSRIIAVIHVIQFLATASVFIQGGVMPYLSKSLGASPVIFGYLETSFAAMQFVGGPFYGRYGDKHGARPALMFALVCGLGVFGITGIATSIFMLFLTRVPAVFMHIFQGCQMVMTDITSDEDRADSLAKLGVSFGLGMVVGPLCGGFLQDKYGPRSASIFAFIATLISLVLVFVFIPTIPKQGKKEGGKSDVLSLQKVLTILQDDTVLFLMSIKMLTTLPFGILQSMNAVVVMDRFDLNAQQNGYIMAVIGVAAMLVQGVGVKAVTSRFSEMVVLQYASFFVAISFIGMCFVETIQTHMVVSLLLVVGYILFGAVLTSVMTKAVDPLDTGTVLGLNMTMHSVVRMIGPLLGGYLTLGDSTLVAIGVFGLSCSTVAGLLVGYKKQQGITLH